MVVIAQYLCQPAARPRPRRRASPPGRLVRAVLVGAALAAWAAVGALTANDPATRPFDHGASLAPAALADDLSIDPVGRSPAPAWREPIDDDSEDEAEGPLPWDRQALWHPTDPITIPATPLADPGRAGGMPPLRC